MTHRYLGETQVQIHPFAMLFPTAFTLLMMAIIPLIPKIWVARKACSPAFTVCWTR